MNLHDLQNDVGDWSHKNFGNQPSYRPLLGVAEEVGELCHSHLKTEQGIRTAENHQAKKCDAVGDIVIYLADYCYRENISLNECVADAWEEVRKRDWTKNKKQGIDS